MRPPAAWLARALRRLRALVRGAELEHEMDEEMRFHLEMEAADLVRTQGLSPEDAWRRARLAFGGVERFREAGRDARRPRLLEDLWSDARYALRMLRRSPGYTLVALLTLGLGIGAAVAVFSIVNGVLLRGLPYVEPERLFTVWESNERGEPRLASYPTFRDWREESDAFAALAFVRGDVISLRADEGTQRLLGAFVSGEFFRALRVRPVVGTAFTDDAAVGGHPVVLSHRLWRERFGGRADALGQTLSGPEGVYTVVGVMPRAAFPVWADVWLPMRARPAADPFFTRRDLHADSDVIARLADGVTAEQARASLEVVAARIAAAHPDEAGEFTRIRLTPLRDRMIGDVTSLLLVLAAAVGLVLLIACVNVAGLVLARALARTRELAVRAALGAGRGRIVRQLLTEALLLAFGGAVAGTLLAAAAVRLFTATAPGALPRLDEVAVDGRVLVFAIAVAASAALLSGLMPALRAAAPDLVPGLRSGTAGAGIQRSGMRSRSALVIAQVALTLVLLVAAGLLMRSLRNLSQEPLGFEPDGVVAVRIFPPSPRYEEAPAAAELFRRIREAAAGVPGVEAAAVANHIPVAGARMATPVRVPGREPTPDDGWVIFRTVSPEYFDVLRIPVLRGRPFVDADLARGGVAIVNEAFVRMYLGDRDPIGAALTAAKAAQGRPVFSHGFAVYGT